MNIPNPQPNPTLGQSAPPPRTDFNRTNNSTHPSTTNTNNRDYRSTRDNEDRDYLSDTRGRDTDHYGAANRNKQDQYGPTNDHNSHSTSQDHRTTYTDRGLQSGSHNSTMGDNNEHQLSATSGVHPARLNQNNNNDNRGYKHHGGHQYNRDNGGNNRNHNSNNNRRDYTGNDNHHHSRNRDNHPNSSTHSDRTNTQSQQNGPPDKYGIGFRQFYLSGDHPSAKNDVNGRTKRDVEHLLDNFWGSPDVLTPPDIPICPPTIIIAAPTTTNSKPNDINNKNNDKNIKTENNPPKRELTSTSSDRKGRGYDDDRDDHHRSSRRDNDRDRYRDERDRGSRSNYHERDRDRDYHSKDYKKSSRRSSKDYEDDDDDDNNSHSKKNSSRYDYDDDYRRDRDRDHDHRHREQNKNNESKQEITTSTNNTASNTMNDLVPTSIPATSTTTMNDAGGDSDSDEGFGPALPAHLQRSKDNESTSITAPNIKADHGRNLLPGEGAALAAFVEKGERIPRRGEVGLEPHEITRFETAGFVMSGSRHATMDAIRRRKESQIIGGEQAKVNELMRLEERKRKQESFLDSLAEQAAKAFQNDKR